MARQAVLVIGLLYSGGQQYAHVIPGMQAEAAVQVAALVANSRPTTD